MTTYDTTFVQTADWKDSNNLLKKAKWEIYLLSRDNNSFLANASDISNNSLNDLEWDWIVKARKYTMPTVVFFSWMVPDTRLTSYEDIVMRILVSWNEPAGLWVASIDSITATDGTIWTVTIVNSTDITFDFTVWTDEIYTITVIWTDVYGNRFALTTAEIDTYE